MRAKKSPLILRDFLLLQQQFVFTSPDQNVIPDEIMNEYEIDIDFTVKRDNEVAKDTDDSFRLFVKIEVNKEKLPGYRLFSEGVGIFHLSADSEISEEDKASLFFSSLSISINMLRSVMHQLTAFAPFGEYILPPIDVNELLKDKEAAIKNHRSRSTK